MLDPDGHRDAAGTPAPQRFKGYTADEIIGQHFSHFYTEDDRAAGLPQRALETAAREGQVRGRRLAGAQGRHALLGLRRHRPDPRRRRRAPRLRQDHARPHRATEGRGGTARAARSTSACWSRASPTTRSTCSTPSGIVTNWNAGAQRIKGYAPDEIVGQHFSHSIPTEDRARGEPARSLATAEREGRFENEGWRLRKDGTRFWANVVIDAIREPSGELIGFAKITRDITERREAADRARRTREALFQSQKMEAIGQLTGGVAHDFNNLLTVVLGSLDLLRRLPDDDPRITRLLDNAMQGAQRGATLTQRMLAFARRQELDLRAGRRGRAGARHERPAAALARPADHHRNTLSRSSSTT